MVQTYMGSNTSMVVISYIYMVLYAYIISIWCYMLILLQTYISIQVLCCLSIALLYAYSMGFISIFYFCSLLRPLFFMIVVAVSLSFGFLRCKGMAVLSDTKHQVMPYSAKTFPESFHKCCTFGFSKKLSTELFGVLTLGTTIS